MTDVYSWGDSDPFEEDDSWMSEPESVCNNWRGWKKAPSGGSPAGAAGTSSGGAIVNSPANGAASGSAVSSLTELSSRVVATYIPFEVVQRYQPPVPEQLQLRIAFWSFPDNEEDIRLYSCLANGSADEFQKGENFYRSRTVQNLLQIGFHLSATVVTSQTLKPCTVAVAFDRGRITSCSCTCVCSSSWCSHVVAVCLHRIFQPTTVSLRAPITESLSRLNQTQLQKFAQYLINEFPQQILPTAQRLLDELLNLDSAINSVWGAPDPTAGALIHDQTKWCLDEHQLHDNIRKILIKLCIPSPMVYSDVNYLSSTQPPAASEWTSLLRPLRGREPEGLWNLLSIVREMLRRHDRNYIPLLKILTEEILACGPILLWWFNTNVSLHRGYHGNNNNNRSSIHSNNHTSQHACSSLCDEIVVLWRLVTLNPALSAQDTAFLFEQLREYHLQTLEMVISASNSGVSGARHQNGSHHQQQQQQNGSIVKTADIEIFGGFKPAMISCLIDWTTYPISGVTNAHRNPYCPSINAASTNTSSVNHAISGTVKMTPWSSKLTAGAAGSGSFSKQSSTESSANGGGEEEGSGTGAEIVNRRLNDSEDSGNNDNWDRVSSASGGSDEVLNRARPRAEGSIPIAQADAAAAAAVAGPSNADADYQIYVYSTAGQNVKSALSGSGRGGGGDSMKNYDPELLAAATVKPIEDSFEILFSRAEALYAHGYVKEACQLSVRLAEELLNRPPVLTLENGGAPRNRFNPALHQISLLASATLSKAAFLCSVLSEHEDSHLLAFYVGLLGLELVRPPASTKALEVKLANQEQELVNSLKRIPLCTRALAVLREKGEQLRDGRLTSRGEALLPLILAGYIFDALVLSTGQGPVSAAYELSTVHTSFLPTAIRLPTDERLAFEASVAAIGLKANVSEADHPLLCEGTRRQRGDLALTLLVYYKDSKDRLNKIMDKLLDKEIHMINRRSQSNSGGGGGGGSSFSNHNHNNNYMLNEVANTLTKLPSTQYHSGGEVLSSHSSPSRSVQQCPNYQALETNALAAAASTSEAAQQQQQQQQATASTSTSNWDEGIKSWDAKFRRLSLNEGSTASTSQPVNVVSSAVNGSSKVAPNTDHSSTAATGTATSSSVDSSSPPETASSDNSPTVSRRSLFQASSSSKQQQSASDSSSSGESSDSFSSSSSTEKKCSPIHRSNLVAGSSSSSTPHHHLSPHHSISSSSVGSGLLQGAASTSAEMTYSDHHLSGTPPTIVDLTNGQSRGSTFESFNAAYMAPNGWNGTPAATVTNSPAPTANSCGNSYSRQSMSTGSLVGGAMPKNNNNSGSTYLQGSSHISHLKPHMRYKGKRGHYPIIPNQPSEASAHFMFELAKTVLAKAGGNNTSVLFTQPPSSSNGRAHRNLHMCAFQIGLYALGLHNAVSPNWLSRTYSSQVSWITAQAMEIGHQAIAFLIDTWEGHFTPNEVASLADRASRGQEQSMVSAAAQLALSCLPHSHALTPSEIQRALIQCKEQSTEMLERACLAVESAAQGGGVNPDVLFHVAHKWHELYDQEAIKARHQGRFEGGPMSGGAAVPYLTGGHLHHGGAHHNGGMVHHPSVTVHAVPAPTSTSSFSHCNLTPRQLSYLHSVYRVGMLAMETLARRVNDDRPQTKYAKNPTYCEDVKWLLVVAKKLGTSFVQDFCAYSANAIGSPFVLLEIINEVYASFEHSTQSGPNGSSSLQPYMASIRSHMLNQLIQKCRQLHSSGYDPGYYKGNRPYGGGSYGSYDPSYHSPQQQQQYSSGYDYVPPPPPPPSYSQSYTPYRKYYKQYLPGPQFCPETGRTVCSKVAPFYPIDEVFSVVKMARAKRFNISSEFVDESENDPEPNLSEEPWPEPEPFLQHSLGGHSFGGGFNVPQQPIAHFHNFDYKPYYGEKYRATVPPYHHQQRSIYANSYSGPHELGAYASASAVAVSHSRYKRQAGGRATELPIEPVCPSRMILIEPKAALNDKRQWKFVVNLSERDPRLKQAIKVEVCT
ncbi:PREDICTED: zinc finger SWIM domain-containing protein 8-like, partial [Rhagoletis zephyria]|uniref:zinc finger SWIM domain-containing protein 8-like n=1 Tax=Rhagoletis zephyria TaxID=28612 RepID=UPI00081128E7